MKMDVLHYNSCARLPICRSDFKCVPMTWIFVEHSRSWNRNAVRKDTGQNAGVLVSDYGIVGVHFSFFFIVLFTTDITK